MKAAIREAKIGCEDERQAEAAGKRIFDRLDQEWEKAEKRYDVETRDGTDLVKQRLASERIAEELAELSTYSVQEKPAQDWPPMNADEGR